MKFVMALSWGLFVLFNFFMLLMYKSDGFEWVSLNIHIKEYMLYGWYFLIFSFVPSLLFAGPAGYILYFLAKKKSRDNYFTASLAGGIITLLPLAMAYILKFNIPILVSREGVLICMVFLFAGASSGALFYKITTTDKNTSI